MSTTLGDYIREQRLAMGYATQAAFADYSGINPAHLNQIERGKIALPNADLRRKLAAALGVSHVEILVRCGELDVSEVVVDTATPAPAERALLPIIRGAAWDDAKLAAAVGSLRAIAALPVRGGGDGG